MGETSGYSISTTDERLRKLHRRLAEDPAARTLSRELTVPAQKGKAFIVETGQILRVSCPEGPQVADFNAFNRDRPRQMFWSGRSRILQGTHLSVGDRLWSTPPEMEPMFTIIADTVEHRARPEGAAWHDLLYGMCDERRHFHLTGTAGMPNCRDNLTGAVAEFGL